MIESEEEGPEDEDEDGEDLFGDAMIEYSELFKLLMLIVQRLSKRPDTRPLRSDTPRR